MLHLYCCCSAILPKNYVVALHILTSLIQKYPQKPQVYLAQAQCLDNLSEAKQSNQLLREALEAYRRYLSFGKAVADDYEYRSAGKRCIERMRFLGFLNAAVSIHYLLIQRFDNDPAQRNELTITYLMANRLSDAKKVAQEVLRRWPNNGLAELHFGYVLKQLDNDYANAIVYLQRGIDSKAPGTQEGIFYFNLGESLQRLGRQHEALAIYKRAADLQLFPSVYQRSLYNVAGLRAQPYWSKEATTYASFLNKLEHNWQAIRNEGIKLLSIHGYFLDETENLRDTGNWKQFELYARGQRKVDNCRKAPITCDLIDEFNAASSCKRGQVKFSVMHPGTHVWPHCGPTNCRLRAHLGLVVPDGTLIRVADEMRTWTEGKFLIFDDSFEHEVWHNGSTLRLVLIVDIWHPDLSIKQRRSLTPI